jgi:hypothetical protein
MDVGHFGRGGIGIRGFCFSSIFSSSCFVSCSIYATSPPFSLLYHADEVVRKSTITLLQELGLGDRGKDMVRRYSGGMAQRLMLAHVRSNNGESDNSGKLRAPASLANASTRLNRASLAFPKHR